MNYRTGRESKAACAKIAIDEGALLHINNAGPKSSGFLERPEPPPISTAPISLDAWYDTLPRPLPSFLGNMRVSEIGPVTLLNEWITRARGARFTLKYFWPMRPGHRRAYLVDSIFGKRSDAKNAVIVSAMLQGVGEYIKAVGVAIENKITPKFRTIVHDQIFPMLNDQCPHTWTYHTDKDGEPLSIIFCAQNLTTRIAYGCTLTVTLKGEEHRYIAESEYRTKADARVAAGMAASKLGLPELLRFQGELPPPGYRSFWETIQQRQQDLSTIPKEVPKQPKRKMGEIGGKTRMDAEPAKGSNSTRRRKRRKNAAMKRETLVLAKEADGSEGLAMPLGEKVPGERPAGISGDVALGTSEKVKATSGSLSSEHPQPSSASPRTHIDISSRPPPPPTFGQGLTPQPLPLPYDLGPQPPWPRSFPGFTYSLHFPPPPNPHAPFPGMHPLAMPTLRPPHGGVSSSK
ncbi:hypothetical protein DXG03_007564 [Asterophora parasitica]|uniref:Uncharacterized protein n=1 Tax=Asterophora parasitica TaxID=117018 RepID=A0A9P7G6C2_9AGAR|nr:hypothetical protein DXG03_007564 [Asterophora parasitica]